MTSRSPAAIAALAEETYARIAPCLGVHSLCREFVAIVAGVCAARGIEYRVVFDKHYRENGVESPHYWIELASARIDMWEPSGRRARLIEDEPARATGQTHPARVVRA